MPDRKRLRVPLGLACLGARFGAPRRDEARRAAAPAHGHPDLRGPGTSAARTPLERPGRAFQGARVVMTPAAVVTQYERSRFAREDGAGRRRLRDRSRRSRVHSRGWLTTARQFR